MTDPTLDNITEILHRQQEQPEHPQRRATGGPSDVEWALLVQKVAGMEVALADLTAEIRAFNALMVNRCATCANADSIKDHEKRIRSIETLVYKAMGIAAVAATIASLFLNHIFPGSK